jgi:hypothetical protein
MKLASAKTGKKSGKAKIRRMSIEPGTKGFITTTHHEQPMNGPYQDPLPTPHETPEAMVSHVASTFGAKPPYPAPKPAAPAAPAPDDETA